MAIPHGRTHAFFADMDGFVLQPPDWNSFLLKADQLHYLISKGYPELDKVVIDDKNKANSVARYALARSHHQLRHHNLHRTNDSAYGVDDNGTYNAFIHLRHAQYYIFLVVQAHGHRPSNHPEDPFTPCCYIEGGQYRVVVFLR
jgi:hypothetical protein